MKHLWIIFLFSVAAFGDGSNWVIHSVNVVDVISGTLLPHRDVTITAGKITDIQPSTDSNQKTTSTIEGAGLYLIPGLWDMHVHLRSNPTDPENRLIIENAAVLELFLANGIIGIREMGGDLADHVITWRDEIRDGKRLGPRILTAGRKLDGAKPAWPGSIAITTPDEAREAVRQIKQSGADFIKIYFAEVSPEILQAISDEAHGFGLKVTGHLPRNLTPFQAMATGIDGLEHQRAAILTEQNHHTLWEERAGRIKAALPMTAVEGTSREIWLHDPGEAKRLNEALAAKQFWITPTLLVENRVRVEIAEREFDNDPRKRYFFPAIWSSWDTKTGLRKPPSAESVAVFKRAVKLVSDRTLEMQKAGVPLLAGSDCGVANNYVLPGWSLHEELQALVVAGLTPVEALRTATINPARWRGEAETEGSIEKGKRADLLLLRSNPLATIPATHEIEGVFLGGDFYPRNALEAMLHRAEDRAAPAGSIARK
jgi:hypothetical protein